MKTFEEAMESRWVPSEAQMCAEREEIIGRYRSLIEEIQNSPSARMFVIAMAEMGETYPEEMSEDDVYLSILMSAFANGVMVGIEMEKAE